MEIILKIESVLLSALVPSELAVFLTNFWVFHNFPIFQNFESSGRFQTIQNHVFFMFWMFRDDSEMILKQFRIFQKNQEKLVFDWFFHQDHENRITKWFQKWFLKMPFYVELKAASQTSLEIFITALVLTEVQNYWQK